MSDTTPSPAPGEREFIDADDYIEVSVYYTVPVVAQVRLYRDPSDDEVWSVHVIDEAITRNANDPPSVWTNPTTEEVVRIDLAGRAFEVAEDSEWPSWEFGL